MPMKIEKVYPGQVIQLGRRGENLARQVEFDLTDWKKQYGDGIPELLFQRFGDARPFIRDLEVVENRAIWTLASWDTDIAKPGKVELRWYCGELLAKSQSWSTSVENALDTPGVAPAVNPEKSWFDEVLIAATGVGAHAEAAKASADDAAASAQEAAEQLANIGDSAQRAEEARAKSEEISKKVTGELFVADVYANNAKVYAEGGSLQELIEQPNGDIWVGMTTEYTRGAQQYAEEAEAAANGGTYASGSFIFSETGAKRYADKAKAYAEGGTYQEYEARQTFGPSKLNSFTVSKGAKQYAEEARTAATEASASMASAQTAATEAYDNRAATNTYKEQARSAAQSANTAAGNASKAETSARSYANAAQSSMQKIEISLAEAQREANKAMVARDEAEAAQTAAETAQAAAEKARDEAQAAAGSGSGGGTGEPEVFIAEYGVTTGAEIEEAYQAGKVVIARKGIYSATLTARNGTATFVFTAYLSGTNKTASWGTWTCSPYSWYSGTATHASMHSSTGADPITPESIGAASTAYVDEAVANAGGGVAVVESWVSTSAEVEAAYQSGKLVVCVDAGMPFHLVFRRSATEHWFANVDSEYYCTYCVINDEWEFHESMYAPRSHADNHKATGWDPITPDMIGAVTKEYVDNAVANAGGGSGLPAHSSADNGKFLRIVDGTPAWATVQNAEEVSF